MLPGRRATASLLLLLRGRCRWRNPARFCTAAAAGAAVPEPVPEPQRMQLCPGVELVAVDNVVVHGNRLHPRGAPACTAFVTDGLRHAAQQELAWVIEHPFPKPGVVPDVVPKTAAYVRNLNAKGAFVRAGDVLDVRGSVVAPFGSLGDSDDVCAVGFAEIPSHDEYWLGRHGFRTPPHPALLCTLLLPAERSYCGTAAGAARLFAAARGYWLYDPFLPFVPSSRLISPSEAQDLTVVHPFFSSPGAACPGSVVRLNGASCTVLGSMVTLALPGSVGELVSGPLAEAAARHEPEPTVLLADPPRGHSRSYGMGVDGLVVLPSRPGKGSDKGDGAVSATGVILSSFPDEGHVDALAALDHHRAPMADPDACSVAPWPPSPDLLEVKLRRRSWTRLAEAFSRRQGLVVPATDGTAMHFEVRFTSGADMPLWQEQTERSRAAADALRKQGMNAFLEADPSAAEQSETEPAAPGELLRLGKEGQRVVVYSGTEAGLDKLSEEDKMKVRLAGRGDLLQKSVSASGGLEMPMTAAQQQKFEAEVKSHARLAGEVKRALRERAEQRLEGNIIRVVWSYNENDPQALQNLTQQLEDASAGWELWRKALVSRVMLFLEASSDVNLPEPSRPDLSPNLCVRYLNPHETKEPEAIFGVMLRDQLIPDAKPLVQCLQDDERLRDCPIDYSFDLFLNVAARGTFTRARRKTTRWTEMEEHYRSLSRQAAERLSSLETEYQKLRVKQAELDRQRGKTGGD